MASEDRHGNEPTGSAVEKLKFISSPLDPRLKRAARAGTNEPEDKRRPRSVNEIKFVQHDDASNLEVLYDLFLAVCARHFRCLKNQSISLQEREPFTNFIFAVLGRMLVDTSIQSDSQPTQTIALPPNADIS